jgi:hypothetical protein
MNTKGFGSKMMAKMGFFVATGLGKDGRLGGWIYQFICIMYIGKIIGEGLTLF